MSNGSNDILAYYQTLLQALVDAGVIQEPAGMLNAGGDNPEAKGQGPWFPWIESFKDSIPFGQIDTTVFLQKFLDATDNMLFSLDSHVGDQVVAWRRTAERLVANPGDWNKKFDWRGFMERVYFAATYERDDPTFDNRPGVVDEELYDCIQFGINNMFGAFVRKFGKSIAFCLRTRANVLVADAKLMGETIGPEHPRYREDMRPTGGTGGDPSFPGTF
jgi:hypothetical protein